eukprot:6462404-Lingulodinium_polyedra.AAC.1
MRECHAGTEMIRSKWLFHAIGGMGCTFKSFLASTVLRLNIPTTPHLLDADASCSRHRCEHA